MFIRFNHHKNGQPQIQLLRVEYGNSFFDDSVFFQPLYAPPAWRYREPYPLCKLCNRKTIIALKLFKNFQIKPINKQFISPVTLL